MRLKSLLDWLRVVFRLFVQVMNARHARKRAARPWHVRIGRKGTAGALSETEIDRLLQRQRDLKDVEKLAELAQSFRLPESDYFADPQHVERLIRHLIAENPPWLHVSRKLTGGENDRQSQGQEMLWREQTTREIQDVTLFVPDETWRDQPLASLTMRSTRQLDEVWQARLLDQVLPPEVLVDRHNRGDILIPVRRGRRQMLEFRAETRKLEVVVRKPVPIPIKMDGGTGTGGQILYVLLDYSASMRGKNAVLALAVIAAALRANLGSRETRYLFRRYALADEIYPPLMELPLSARTLAEKDRLLDQILATSFNGSATHVNDALNAAIADIKHLRLTENLDADILLVTDGQAEMLENTPLRLREANVKVHTVMVTAEPNPGLAALSESFTALDIPIAVSGTASAPAEADAALQPRRNFQI